MGDAIISRRGGTPFNRTEIPSINFVSKTSDDIVVTFTNNQNNEINLYYGIDQNPPTTKITLAANATSSTVTFSGLNLETQYTVSAYAIVTDTTLKKIKSEIVSTAITTLGIVYTAATGGTTLEYDSGGKRYKSHTFTSNGTFEVTTQGTVSINLNRVDYLIVAGGGGGGARNNQNGTYSSWGGGGAGGYRTGFTTVATGNFPITAGAGGNGESNGGLSSAFSIESVGGGAGVVNFVGQSGGSGAGGATDFTNRRNGGLGTSGQGNNGGTSALPTSNSSSMYNSGGGGGAGGPGNTGTTTTGGNGGNGLANSLRTGSNETRAGGGGGGRQGTTGQGNGGSGGGGRGDNPANAVNAAFLGTSGTANTGGGGGGLTTNFNGLADSSNGGSGIVIIRYEIAPSV